MGFSLGPNNTNNGQGGLGWHLVIISLKSRLALTYSALLLLAAALLSAGVGYFVTERTKASIGTSLGELAFTIGDRLDRDMFFRYRDLVSAAMIISHDIGSHGTLRRDWIEELQRSFPYYTWIGFADTSGRVIASTGGLLEGESVAQRPWFSGALEKPFFGDVHKALLLERLLPRQDGPWRFVDVAVPVRDAQGRVIGVLGAHLSWGWVEETQASVLELAAHRQPAEALLVSADGEVLLGPKPLQGQQLALPDDTPSPAYFVQRFADGDEYLTGMVSTPGHRDYPGLGWQILVRQDLASAFAPVRELQIQILLWGLGTAIVFFLASWWSAARITAPLRAIAQAAERLRAGDPQAAFPAHVGYREGQQLIQSLRALVGQLRDREEHFRSTFEQAAVGIAHVGLDGRWLRINQRLCGILGYEPEEAMRLTFQGITHPDDLAGDLALFEQLLGGKISTYTLEKR